MESASCQSFSVPCDGTTLQMKCSKSSRLAFAVVFLDADFFVAGFLVAGFFAAGFFLATDFAATLASFATPPRGVLS